MPCHAPCYFRCNMDNPDGWQQMAVQNGSTTLASIVASVAGPELERRHPGLDVVEEDPDLE